MKRIVYLVICNGIEGKDKDNIQFASFDEDEMNKFYDEAKNKNWYRKSEKIIDVGKESGLALRRLNPLGRLLLQGVRL